MSFSQIKNRIFFLLLSTPFFLLGVLSPVFADGNVGIGVSSTSGSPSVSEGVHLRNFFGPSYILSIEDLLLKIMTFLGTIIVLASTIGIVTGGSFLVFSGGDDGKISRGKDIIVYSLIGLAVTIGSYLIVTLVQAILYGIGTS